MQEKITRDYKIKKNESKQVQISAGYGIIQVKNCWKTAETGIAKRTCAGIFVKENATRLVCDYWTTEQALKRVVTF